jgi:hypothetical protein
MQIQIICQERGSVAVLAVLGVHRDGVARGCVE